MRDVGPLGREASSSREAGGDARERGARHRWLKPARPSGELARRGTQHALAVLVERLEDPHGSQGGALLIRQRQGVAASQQALHEVAQSVERRLDRLPVSLGELLNLAAVLGRGVGFELWLAASGRDEEALLTTGDELCARGLLLAAVGLHTVQPRSERRPQR